VGAWKRGWFRALGRWLKGSALCWGMSGGVRGWRGGGAGAGWGGGGALCFGGGVWLVVAVSGVRGLVVWRIGGGLQLREAGGGGGWGEGGLGGQGWWLLGGVGGISPVFYFAIPGSMCFFSLFFCPVSRRFLLFRSPVVSLQNACKRTFSGNPVVNGACGRPPRTCHFQPRGQSVFLVTAFPVFALCPVKFCPLRHDLWFPRC